MSLHRFNDLLSLAQFRWLLWLSLMLASLSALQASACLTPAALNMVLKQELATLRQRIPPAFGDAVDDGLIQSELALQDANTCALTLTMVLPQADIDEAQGLLAAQPAKQIMLTAQGYRLPEQPRLQVTYRYDVVSQQPLASEVLQTGALGQLRANVELMYAMLTQARVNPTTANTSSEAKSQQAWTPEQIAQAQRVCSTMHPELSGSACACWVNGMTEKVSYRQLTYYQYLNSNPYAFASGNGVSLKSSDKALAQQCKQP